jgi:ArsR family transcriptional regulator
VVRERAAVIIAVSQRIPGRQSLPSKGSASLQTEVFERQAQICKAFANPTRLRMLDLLGRRDWAASELQKELRISKANLSQHVAVLKGAGIVTSRREGKVVYFSLTMPEVKSACQLIRDVLRAQIRGEKRLSV